MPDVFQFIDDIDNDKQAMVATRLEDRAQMPQFVAIRESYFDTIGLPASGSILELGCGTGAVCRAIASREGFAGTVVGWLRGTEYPFCQDWLLRISGDGDNLTWTYRRSVGCQFIFS